MMILQIFVRKDTGNFTLMSQSEQVSVKEIGLLERLNMSLLRWALFGLFTWLYMRGKELEHEESK